MPYREGRRRAYKNQACSQGRKASVRIGNGAKFNTGSHLLNGEKGCRRLYRVWALALTPVARTGGELGYDDGRGGGAGLSAKAVSSFMREGAALLAHGQQCPCMRCNYRILIVEHHSTTESDR
jgi:hypothetical protein